MIFNNSKSNFRLWFNQRQIEGKSFFCEDCFVQHWLERVYLTTVFKAAERKWNMDALLKS